MDAVLHQPRTKPALRTKKQHVDEFPDTTGETEKGRSTRVMSRLLPRKSNLAIAHAAHIPNTRLKGTAIAATVSVSRSADCASGLIKCREIGRKPAAERFSEDGDEGQEEKQQEKQNGNSDSDRP